MKKQYVILMGFILSTSAMAGLQPGTYSYVNNMGDMQNAQIASTPCGNGFAIAYDAVPGRVDSYACDPVKKLCTRVSSSYPGVLDGNTLELTSDTSFVEIPLHKNDARTVFNLSTAGKTYR